MTKFCIFDPIENKTVDKIDINYSEPFGSQIYYGDRLFSMEAIDSIIYSGLEVNRMLDKDLDWLEEEEEAHLQRISDRIKNFKIIEGAVSYNVDDPNANHFKEAILRNHLKTKIMEVMSEEQGIMSSFSEEIIDRYFAGAASSEFAYIKIYYVRVQECIQSIIDLGLDVEISGVHKSIIVFKNQEDYNMALLTLDEKSIEMNLTLSQVHAIIEYYKNQFEPDLVNLFS